MNAELRAELMKLVEEDQAFRKRGPELSQQEIVDAMLPERERTTRLREIVETHGWPGRSLVGEDGAFAAWLLAQHADDDVSCQERCLELLRAAVDAGEASSRELAYLTDRVLVSRGQPQVYGTQFQQRGDELVPRPIEAAAGLDERRRAAGLEPFAEYERRIHSARDR